MMDAFDIDPTNFASASLACGAIAIDPADSDRVYVGTGEGETHEIFAARIVSALPPIAASAPSDGRRRSDGYPSRWWLRRVTGEAFTLAVDPANREHVVGATSAGLYHRVPQGAAFEWTRVRPGVHSSVVVAGAGGSRKFFAAEWGTGVVGSSDGQTWTAAGTGFPTNDVGRITLGSQAGNGAVVYALVARNSNGTLHGVYRLDTASGKWKVVSGPPDVLPAPQGSSQGAYDLALAVDPADINRLYLGGSYTDTQPFPGSIWRADVKTSGAGFAFANARAIGTHAHADVHVLVHSPADPQELWCGCDGGVFLNRDPGGTGEFAGMNTGLSCLCSNFIAQHPTDPNILFTGLQDNGSARTPGGPMWTHVNSATAATASSTGDPTSPHLRKRNGVSPDTAAPPRTRGPRRGFPVATMTQPIVGTPFNLAAADAVWQWAQDRRFLSAGFRAVVETERPMALLAPLERTCSRWRSPRQIASSSARRRAGKFRADRAGTMTLTQIDNARLTPSSRSHHRCRYRLGGCNVGIGLRDVRRDGGRRRVWLDVRGGPAGAVRPETICWTWSTTRLRSIVRAATCIRRRRHRRLALADSGATWAPLQNGLPDAPVFDLQIHPTQRLLRAATHGRGVRAGAELMSAFALWR